MPCTHSSGSLLSGLPAWLGGNMPWEWCREEDWLDMHGNDAPQAPEGGRLRCLVPWHGPFSRLDCHNKARKRDSPAPSAAQAASAVGQIGESGARRAHEWCCPWRAPSRGGKAQPPWPRAWTRLVFQWNPGSMDRRRRWVDQEKNHWTREQRHRTGAKIRTRTGRSTNSRDGARNVSNENGDGRNRSQA